MYMLVPDEPNIGFVTLAVIFVAATLLGFASHAPGGIGVFDAAMLVALWQFDKEELLAGLLLFRLLYYIVPFALSLVILGVRELLIGFGKRPPPVSPLQQAGASDDGPETVEGGREAQSIVGWRLETAMNDHIRAWQRGSGLRSDRCDDDPRRCRARAAAEWLDRIVRARIVLAVVAAVFAGLWAFGTLRR